MNTKKYDYEPQEDNSYRQMGHASGSRKSQYRNRIGNTPGMTSVD